MTQRDHETDIRTLPTLSRDSQLLAELHGEWRDLDEVLRRAPSVLPYAEALRDLMRRVESHRAMLFAANASLQVERSERDRTARVEFDANVDAIKFCTVMLGEMRARLGLSSLPPPVID